MRARQISANKIPLFAYQHVPVAVTGTASEVTLFSTTIPGGTLGANGVLDVTSFFSYNNSADYKIMRVRFGGQALFSQGANTNINSHIKNIIRNRSNTASQICTPLSFFASFGHGGAAAWTGTVDTSVDQPLLITGAVTTQTAQSATITRTGGTATVTATAHGYSNGDSILIAGANQADYNGTFIISNVTANTFDYTVPNSPVTPATGTITAARWSTLTLESVIVEVKAA